MALNDDRYIPPTPNSLQEVQELLRDLWETVHTLEGRVGDISLRANLNVAGSITSTGDLSTNLTTDGSVELDNFLQINERVFDKEGTLVPEVSSVGSSRIYMDPTLDKLQVSENGGAYTDLVQGAPTLPSQSCRVYKDTSTSLPHDTSVTVSFNQERWDTDSMHDNSTNPSRITIQTTGKYILGASIHIAAGADAIHAHITIRRGGTTVVTAQSSVALAGLTRQLSLDTLIDGVIGEYYEVVVYQFSYGAATNTLSSIAEYSPEFWAIRVQ